MRVICAGPASRCRQPIEQRRQHAQQARRTDSDGFGQSGKAPAHGMILAMVCAGDRLGRGGGDKVGWFWNRRRLALVNVHRRGGGGAARGGVPVLDPSAGEDEFRLSVTTTSVL